MDRRTRLPRNAIQQCFRRVKSSVCLPIKLTASITKASKRQLKRAKVTLHQPVSRWVRRVGRRSIDYNRERVQSPGEGGKPSTRSEKEVSQHVYNAFGALPPELWSAIFMHASDPYPTSMSIHDFGIYDSIVTPQVSCLELRRRLYKRSLQMKITISSVCNSWRELNAPYLYQSIRITRAVQVDALLNAFNEDEARRQRALEEGKERIPGGSYALMVRELWLDSNICSCQTPDAFKSLVALLKRCTGITVFRKFGRYGCSTPELEETQGILAAQVLPSSSCGDIGLCKPPGPTHIDWAFMNSYVFQHFFAKNPELNDSLPSVRTLELRPSYIDLLEDLPEDSAILRHIPHFPALTCLRVLGSRAFAQAAKFVMPSLRSVMIYSPAFDRDDEDHTISCLLAEHGPKLEELEFDLALHRPRLESIDLEDSCPNLRRLHLPASVFTGTHTLKFGHSNLHTLGIRGMHRLVYDQTNADFQSKLLDFVERFPGLKAVQDLSTKSHEFRERSVSLWNAQDALSYRAFWSGLLGSLEKKGVQLLDWSGEPVKGFEERKFMSIMPCEADKVSEGLICCH